MSILVDRSVYRSPFSNNPGFRGLLAGLRIIVRRWRQRSYERHMLALMNEAQLKDIGLTRIDARREVNKPCWRR